MFDHILQFIKTKYTKEQYEMYKEAITLIWQYGMSLELDPLADLIELDREMENAELLMKIENLIRITLESIIQWHYILLNNPLDTPVLVELVKCMTMLENYIDSDVILEMYDANEDSTENAIRYFVLVSKHSEDFFDTSIKIVLDEFINNLLEKHEDESFEILDNSEVVLSHVVNRTKKLAQVYPDALGVKQVKQGLIKCGMGEQMLFEMFRNDLQAMENEKELALAIYSLYTVSPCEDHQVLIRSKQQIEKHFADFNTITKVNMHLDDIHRDVGVTNENS